MKKEKEILEIPDIINFKKVETKLTLAQKIILIQNNMSLFAEKIKGKTGLSYDYFTETTLLQALKPELAKYGVGYLFSLAKTGSLLTKEGNYWLFQRDGTLKLFNYDDDNDIEIIQICFIGQNTDPSKAKGTAITYTMKYWLKLTFGIPSDELDPDRDNVIKKDKITEVVVQVPTETQKIKPGGLHKWLLAHGHTNFTEAQLASMSGEELEKIYKQYSKGEK